MVLSLLLAGSYLSKVFLACVNSFWRQEIDKINYVRTFDFEKETNPMYQPILGEMIVGS